MKKISQNVLTLMHVYHQMIQAGFEPCDRTLRRRMLYPAELLDRIREFQQELIWLYVDSRCVLSIIIDRSIIS